MKSDIEKKESSFAKEKFGVMLPCSEGDFKEFIAGLLGETQKISKIVFGQFQIKHEHIVGFHHLISQRLEQNYNAQLLAVSVKIVYDDNSIVTFDNIHSFESYNEIKPIVSMAVHISWIILVQFPTSKTPEKQNIDVSIVSNRYKNIPIYDQKDLMHLMASFAEGYISFCINHTMRSWGADIESLLSNNINTLMIDETPAKKYLRKKADTISSAFSICLLVICISTLGWYLYNNNLNQQAFVASIIENSDRLEEKINFIVKFIADGAWVKFVLFSIVFLAMSLLISIMSGVFLNYILEKEYPSFVLLTDKSRQEMEKVITKIRHKKIKLGISIFVSFIVNVVAALCYEKLIK